MRVAAYNRLSVYNAPDSRASGRCAFFCTAAADSGADSRRPEFPPFVAGIPGANGFCGNSAGSAADAAHDMELQLVGRFPHDFRTGSGRIDSTKKTSKLYGVGLFIVPRTRCTNRIAIPVDRGVDFRSDLGSARCVYICGSGGSVAEWLACWTRAQKSPGSNRSRDAVG